MALRAGLFRGDAKLEAAAASDPAHIVAGAQGEHVRKIQLALIRLDGATLDTDGVYGPATAAAVLAYKQKRKIINRSYQTKADNIVGKMTMAALDEEMLAQEVVPTGPMRFEAIFPVQRPAQRTSGFISSTPNRSLLAFAGVPLGWTPANAHTLDKVKIARNPEDIWVFAKSPGRTTIQVRPFNLFSFDPFLTVIVPCEVGVFFHFLDGPQGVKTVRKESDLEAILKTMNAVYQRNHAGFVFFNRGVNPSLRVSGLGREIPAVRLHGHGGPDFDAIAKNEKSNILFNVFFAGSLADLSGTNIEMNNFLAITTRPPTDSKPWRCCICRDAQRSDPPGIDPGKTLAHEAGHALGEDDDQKDTGSLMYWKQSGQTDTRIDAGMAARMLSSFKQFPP